jgi:hypothetical protein
MAQTVAAGGCAGAAACSAPSFAHSATGSMSGRVCEKGGGEGGWRGGGGADGSAGPTEAHWPSLSKHAPPRRIADSSASSKAARNHSAPVAKYRSSRSDGGARTVPSQTARRTACRYVLKRPLKRPTGGTAVKSRPTCIGGVGGGGNSADCERVERKHATVPAAHPPTRETAAGEPIRRRAAGTLRRAILLHPAPA